MKIDIATEVKELTEIALAIGGSRGAELLDLANRLEVFDGASIPLLANHDSCASMEFDTNAEPRTTPSTLADLDYSPSSPGHTLYASGKKIMYYDDKKTADEREASGYDAKSSYYAAGGIESHDVIKAKLTVEQYQGWHLGVVRSYLDRFNFKHVGNPEEQVREIEKCVVHLNWLANSLRENLK